MRILVFASGRGSNFEAIAKAVHEGTIPNSEIIALFSNHPNAGAIEIARRYKIPVTTLDSNLFRNDRGKFDRKAYETKAVEMLSSFQPDIVCLAGYMLLMGPSLLHLWPGRIINIHPSLLPKHKGLNAQAQAIEAGDKEAGCTVHFVTLGMDEGPTILQNRVPILEADDEQSLSVRTLPVEHQTYCEALRKIENGEVPFPLKF